jgi:hypothetical protein
LFQSHGVRCAAVLGTGARGDPRGWHTGERGTTIR